MLRIVFNIRLFFKLREIGLFLVCVGLNYKLERCRDIGRNFCFWFLVSYVWVEVYLWIVFFDRIVVILFYG